MALTYSVFAHNLLITHDKKFNNVSRNVQVFYFALQTSRWQISKRPSSGVGPQRSQDAIETVMDAVMDVVSCGLKKFETRPESLLQDENRTRLLTMKTMRATKKTARAVCAIVCDHPSELHVACGESVFVPVSGSCLLHASVCWSALLRDPSFADLSLSWRDLWCIMHSLRSSKYGTHHGRSHHHQMSHST